MKPQTPSPKVIALINAGRKALNLRPLRNIPKGRRDNCISCPIHNAFWTKGQYPGVRLVKIVQIPKIQGKSLAKAWGQRTRGTGDEVTVYLPKVLRTFIRRFDAGKYPELVTKS